MNPKGVSPGEAAFVRTGRGNDTAVANRQTVCKGASAAEEERERLKVEMDAAKRKQEEEEAAKKAAEKEVTTPDVTDLRSSRHCECKSRHASCWQARAAAGLRVARAAARWRTRRRLITRT